MPRFLFLAAALCLFCGLPAIAQQVSATGTPGGAAASNGHLLNKDQVLPHIQQLSRQMNPEWLSCTLDSDCALVTYNCAYEALAANKTHLRDVQAEVCKTELCAWMKCSAMPFYSYSASCSQGRCETKAAPLQTH